jgi:signal transduction histidine kinase
MTAARFAPTFGYVISAGNERRSLVAIPVLDVALAIAVGVVQVVGAAMIAAHAEPHAHHLNALGLILLAATPVALLVRRRWPVRVYAIALTASVTYQAIGYPPGPEWLGLLIAFVTVIMAGYRRIGVALLFAAYVLSQWLPPLLGTGSAPPLALALSVPAWLLVVFLTAEWLRQRRIRAVESARLRREASRRQVTEERLRIARELHDVLAQNISLIHVQAATTLFQVDAAVGSGSADERALRALATIKEVSHETLLALRSVLGALRYDSDGSGGSEAPRAPAPSIGRLDDMVARVVTMGVTAQVEQRGPVRPLPPSVDLAAYRILQEALTNVARHSAATIARVQVTYGDADVVVQVDDDGKQQRPGFVRGTGITGMAERATALGGNLEAGPKLGGGFRVCARLPIEEAG